MLVPSFGSILVRIRPPKHPDIATPLINLKHSLAARSAARCATGHDPAPGHRTLLAKAPALGGASEVLCPAALMPSNHTAAEDAVTAGAKGRPRVFGVFGLTTSVEANMGSPTSQR
ncbi:hypothetical protein TgHK011_004144 [Trichoderma gracile]|nr:hypothetical protein TgHK011_004144 [Trichoderma gracile]